MEALGLGAQEEESGLHDIGPPPPEVTAPFLPTSVTLMDTSTAQGELGWLLDPPEDGVSVRGGKAQSCRPVGNGRRGGWRNREKSRKNWKCLLREGEGR